MTPRPSSLLRNETMDEQEHTQSWWIYRGRDLEKVDERPDSRCLDALPSPPPWRVFTPEARRERGRKYRPSRQEITLVNAALYLRRPLLITGSPGSGKSSLAYAVAEELELGEVLKWPITTRTTLAQGLYHYDAIARVYDATIEERVAKGKSASEIPRPVPDIGRYIRLGPLGTAFLPRNPPHPRVLLIDEIDKSDIDLPNDLLHLFEEGEFEIRELSRLPKNSSEQIEVSVHGSDERVALEGGKVRANTFPFVVMTSNEEREFPPAFLRRCLRLDIHPPNPKELERIVQRHLDLKSGQLGEVRDLIDRFVDLRDREGRELATDQLLQAAHMLFQGADPAEGKLLEEALLRSLSEVP